MTKKLTKKDEELICKSNKSPKRLSDEFGVHESTISRVLKKHNVDKHHKLVKVTNFSTPVRTELFKLLLGLDITNPNFVISEMERYFIIKLRNTNDEIDVFNVTEWKD